MSCSANKLKSHMLFTCKNFMFSDFTWKKINFAPGNGVGGGGEGLAPPPPCPPAPPFLYGPASGKKQNYMSFDSVYYSLHF